jgi:2-polyprenyl-3-methyl-5-hydroxy-6-metoxy-1,4-benzoquinol methylase
MTSIEQLKEYYDVHTQKKLLDYIYGNDRVQSAYETLNGFLQNDIKRILEVGCGIGYISYNLSQKPGIEKVVGFDISPKSVEIATKLFQNTNLFYCYADSLAEASFSKGEKYDCIILMDVYEHIAIEDRPQFLKQLNDLLSENGFIFLSCPTPAYQNWLKSNEPHLVQPIDELIDLDALFEAQHSTNTKIKYFALKSIWKTGDYFHVVLSRIFFKANKKPSTKVSLKMKIKDNMLGTLLAIRELIFKKLSPNAEIKRRKHLVETKFKKS